MDYKKRSCWHLCLFVVSQQEHYISTIYVLLLEICLKSHSWSILILLTVKTTKLIHLRRHQWLSKTCLQIDLRRLCQSGNHRWMFRILEGPQMLLAGALRSSNCNFLQIDWNFLHYSTMDCTLSSQWGIEWFWRARFMSRCF